MRLFGLSFFLFTALAGASLLPSLASAQITISGSTFEPGGTAGGGGLSLSGTVGQPDASEHQDGLITLQGGFWNNGAEEPLWIDLLYFRVADRGDGIEPQLRWETITEISNVGFNIYRGIPKNGGWARGEKINAEIIVAQGDELAGATYEFLDPLPYSYGSGVRAYYLEDIDIMGNRKTHGPVLLEVDASYTSVKDWPLF